MSQAVSEAFAINDFDQSLQQNRYKEKTTVALQLGAIVNASQAQVLVVMRNLATDAKDLHNDGFRTIVDWMCFYYGFPISHASQTADVAMHLHEVPLLFTFSAPVAFRGIALRCWRAV